MKLENCAPFDTTGVDCRIRMSTKIKENMNIYEYNHGEGSAHRVRMTDFVTKSYNRWIWRLSTAEIQTKQKKHVDVKLCLLMDYGNTCLTFDSSW
ncbi:hypothetical protein C5167_003276 [Papaver somniferum]|uniref:Uncharacterized protein n=1 Tax=Papaver somniferum TaxID=3469 RepID=A0A4Y7L3S6_PAPSO|nr:hypothetical protein C5167_003276 [Papaver somniferum]